jgi:hypothetical protein
VRERVWLGVILRMCMYAACMPVRVSIDMGIQMHTLSVVNSGPLFTLIPCKDFINTCTHNLFSKSGPLFTFIPCHQ